MKMLSGSLKSIGAIVVVFLTYINHTFSPLFWVLCGLVFIDLLLNIHKEGQQVGKLASTGMTLGIPTLIANNINQPHLGMYIVAVLCLGYLQLVVPQLTQAIGKLKFSSNKVTQQADQATIDAVLKMLEDRAGQEAQAVIQSTKLAGTASQAPAAKDEQKGGA